MKLLIVFAVTACMLAGAEVKTRKPPTPKPAAAPANLVLPDRAVKAQDGSYRFTDAQGKHWVYWKTPFGVAARKTSPRIR